MSRADAGCGRFNLSRWTGAAMIIMLLASIFVPACAGQVIGRYKSEEVNGAEPPVATIDPLVEDGLPQARHPAAEQLEGDAPTAMEDPLHVLSASLPKPVSFLSPAEAGQTALRLFADDGERLLAVDREGFSSLKWSPTGHLGAAVISTGTERALIVVDVSSRAVRRTLSVTTLDGYLAFRPAADWSRLLVLRSDGPATEFWVVDLPAGTTRKLTQTVGTIVLWHISGDGRWVLAGVEAEGHFVSTLFLTQDASSYEISQASHPVAEFSPGGRWLALVGQEAGDSLVRATVVDLNSFPDDSAVRVLVGSSVIEPALSHEWGSARFFSQAGDWLAVTLAHSDGPRLHFRNLVNNSRSDFSLEPGEKVRWIYVYPDSRRALAVTSMADHVWRLHLLHLEQQVAIPFLEGAKEFHLLRNETRGLAAFDAGLPDGRRLLVVTDVPRGSSFIKLRGSIRALDVNDAGTRAIVALGQPRQELVHVLDLQVGGTITWMGISRGSATRRSSGGFAPQGPAAWSLLWDNDGLSTLVLTAGDAGPGLEAAQDASSIMFTLSGSHVVYAVGQPPTTQVWVTTAQGTDSVYLGSGYAPRWHGVP